MIDPFYSPSLRRSHIARLLDYAEESDHPGIAPGSLKVMENLLNTYHPLRFYRALRIAAMHAALTTDSTTTFDYEHASLPAAVLDPRNSDIMSMKREPTEEEVITRLLIRAVLASIVEVGIPKPTDIHAPDRGSPLHSPAAAEQFQMLTSAWSAEGSVSWGDNHMRPHRFSGLYETDLSGRPEAVIHNVMLPILLPTDRLNFMHPNRGYNYTHDEYYDYPGIPLAWTWNPTVAIDTMDKDGLRYQITEASARTAAEKASYANSYNPLDDHKLVAFSKKYGLGYRPQNPGDDSVIPDRVPEWRYAIIEIQESSGPGFIPELDMTSWMPQTFAHAGKGAFRLSAAVRQARVLSRLKAGTRLPNESLENAWWGADAANYAVWSGMPREKAAQFLDDMSCGTSTEAMVPYARTLETSQSELDGLCSQAKSAFPTSFPAYGQFAALQSGMRYLSIALMNRHFSAVTGLNWLDSCQVQGVPSAKAMQDMAILYGHKNRRFRKDNDRRMDMPVVERRGNRPAPIGTSNLRLFFSDHISSSDISVARSIIAPGALSTVENMLRSGLSGDHGEVVQKWVENILAQVPLLAQVQAGFVKEEIEVVKRTAPSVLRLTLKAQRRANEEAAEKQRAVVEYPMPVALQDVVTSNKYVQKVASASSEDIFKAIDKRAAAIRAGTSSLVRLLDNFMPEKPLTKDEKQRKAFEKRAKRVERLAARYK